MRRSLRGLRIFLGEQCLKANRKQESRRNQNRRAPAEPRSPRGSVDNIHDPTSLCSLPHPRISKGRRAALGAGHGFLPSLPVTVGTRIAPEIARRRNADFLCFFSTFLGFFALNGRRRKLRL